MTIENTDNNANAGTDSGGGGDPSRDHITLDNGGNDGGNADDVFQKHIDMAIEAQDGKATGTDAASGTDKSPEGSQKQATAGTDSGSGAANSNSQQTNQQQTEKGAAPAGPVGGQPLVLKGQGPGGTDLVINSGVERRLYEQGRLVADQLRVSQDSARQLADQNTTLQTKLDAMSQTMQTVQGMAPEHLAIAARLFHDLRTDPVGALTKLIAEAQAKGLTIEGAGGNLSAEAIRAIIREETQKTAQAEPSEAEIVADAQETAKQFFSQFPDAKLHEAHIARILHDHPSVSLTTAYFKLREGFVERGLDWNQPLEPQLAAHNNQQQTTNTSDAANSQQQNNNGANVSMPNGRPNPAPNSAGVNEVAEVAHESTSYDEIIRKAMAQAGLTTTQ